MKLGKLPLLPELLCVVVGTASEVVVEGGGGVGVVSSGGGAVAETGSEVDVE